jgi:hypothetical protein
MKAAPRLSAFRCRRDAWVIVIRHGAPAFIEIDWEGAEFVVLKRGDKTISARRQTISFEFGLGAYSAYGVGPDEVYRWFSDLGYLMYVITGRPLNLMLFKESCAIGEIWDFVAIPAEKKGLCPPLFAF